MRFIQLVVFGGCIIFPSLLLAATNINQSSILTLSDLMPSSEQITLRTDNSEYNLFFPLSPRIHVNKVKLHLEYTNSISLLESRSQLGVLINDVVIAQLPLKPEQAKGIVDINVPTKILIDGYNKVTFSAQQHYTLECEDPSAPELWTQINTKATQFEITSSHKKISPKLSDLSDLIDRRLWKKYAFNVVTAANELDDYHLNWGALTSQGVALRLDYLPLQVHHLRLANFRSDETANIKSKSIFKNINEQAFAGRDTILIGTRTELLPYLSYDILNKITNGYLGIYPNSKNSESFILVISGTNEQEVSKSVAAFSHMNFPLPKASSILVNKTQLPMLEKYTARATLRENGQYEFQQLGYNTTTLWGNKESNRKNISLDFWMPPDLFSSDKKDVELSLHFSYGAALREDSVLNISLNGLFERAVLLNDVNGGVFRDYKLYIPVRSFLPGKNTLKFEPLLMPFTSDRCEASHTSNLALTIFDDSQITLPDAKHYVSMPNIELLAKTGFPYTVFPDGSDLLLKVSEREDDTLAAAWTFAGKLGQIIGTPLHQLKMTFDLSDSTRNIILIGSVATLDKTLMVSSPLAFGEYTLIPYPLRNIIASTKADDNWWQPISHFWSELAGIEQVRAETKSAKVWQSGGLGDNVLMTQFESPLLAGKTITVITAENPELLWQGVSHLMKPELWNNLQGDLVLWNIFSTNLNWLSAAKTYHVGEINFNHGLAYYFSHHPVYGTLLTMLLLIFLSGLIYLLLRYYKLRHHPTVKDIK